MPIEDAVQAPRVAIIYRYPVKSLSAEALTAVDLTAGRPLPLDRIYAIENGPSRFDPENPAQVTKTSFLTLMRDERLALLATTLDSETLTISRGGKRVLIADLGTATGRRLVEQFFAAFMAPSLRGPPRLVSSAGHSFSDAPDAALPIVNLASIRDLERTVGRAIEPLRFRPTLVVDGLPAWAEVAWMGREIALGKDVRCRVVGTAGRCGAANVNPTTGARDMDLPAVLARKWGHANFGVFAEVIQGGRLAVGDAVAVSQNEARPRVGGLAG